MTNKVNGHVYFIGIGGIGMSALARYYKAKGYKISGFDRTASTLTSTLEKEGMNIHYCEDINLIPSDITQVIYTSAVNKEKNNAEFEFALQKGIPVLERAEILGLLTQSTTTCAVAGTHGKTTITAMLSHILHKDRDIAAFIGGIASNYNSNLILDPQPQCCVVEADEYNRSFLHLYPDIAVVSAIDADHLDIYGSVEELEKSFSDFVKGIKKNGVLITKPTLLPKLQCQHLQAFTYDFDDKRCHFYAQNHRITNVFEQSFDLCTPQGIVYDIVLHCGGIHNVENAVAAAAVALCAGVNPQIIKSQLSTYQTVKRRFEPIIVQPNRVYIDDYGHHPQELKKTILSAKKIFPNKTICGIFQPHLYSRTRDLADDFARSLELLDIVVLLPIYPAREQPIANVNSEMLLNKINKKDKYLVQKEQLIPLLHQLQFDVLLTMGAGDIDRLPPLLEKEFSAS
ncbi:MAG: UDP-N-acetylmuramate--L-alanine ligase [Bacteroidales bacterium]|jgi:UDP-N-acetylmuramate--alanine ligase|nr:UDP-N-acetylmuramate--L-alanine ligase [Bacteroidales bacterium]